MMQHLLHQRLKILRGMAAWVESEYCLAGDLRRVDRLRLANYGPQQLLRPFQLLTDIVAGRSVSAVIGVAQDKLDPDRDGGLVRRSPLIQHGTLHSPSAIALQAQAFARHLPCERMATMPTTQVSRNDAAECCAVRPA